MKQSYYGILNILLSYKHYTYFMLSERAPGPYKPDVNGYMVISGLFDIFKRLSCHYIYEIHLFYFIGLNAECILRSSPDCRLDAERVRRSGEGAV